MIPFSGQLGSGALGKFELGVPQILGVFTPHIDHALSAVASGGVGSHVSGGLARSSVTASSPRSSLSGGGAIRSRVSGGIPRSEVR